jgi:hypothetical protein
MRLLAVTFCKATTGSPWRLTKFRSTVRTRFDSHGDSPAGSQLSIMPRRRFASCAAEGAVGSDSCPLKTFIVLSVMLQD